MDFVSVSSSTLQAVAYDPTSSTLRVRFRTGAEYEYAAVPERVYRGLLSALSKGSYFHSYVREAGYRYRQVR